ncbi:hypothetical protein HK405_007378 [Cladochytrium tenue]|nr:hypothetical protein HK405_007378 [Cladochytrium tenue]
MNSDCPALIDALRALSNVGVRLHYLELKGVFVTSDLLDALKPLVDERTASLSMDASVNIAPSLTDLFASLFSGNLSRVKLDGFMKTDLASAIVAANAEHLKVFHFVCADGEGAGLPGFDKVGNLESLALDYRDAEYPSFLSSIFFGHSELLVNLVLTLDLTGSAADFPLDAILAAAPNLRAFKLDDLGIDDVGPLDNAFKESITLLAQRLRLLTIYLYSAKDVAITLRCATELQLRPGKLKRLVFVCWWYDRLDAATKERLRQVGRNSQGLVEFVGYYQRVRLAEVITDYDELTTRRFEDLGRALD